MMPLAFLAAGLVALATGAVVLRSFGPRYRVGRLLSTTPRVSVAEAIELAAGEPRYVAVHGRIDAGAPFEDDAHRPLVYRRTRFERRDGRAWVTFDDQREAVAFQVQEGLDAIGVDARALDAGLIVVRRESLGTAADVPDRLTDDIPGETPVRVRIEQVSAVEHAIVVGVPGPGVDGAAQLSAGLGRPLILTTLEPPEAIRLLAEGRTTRPVVAAACLAVGLVFVSLGLVAAVLETIL